MNGTDAKFKKRKLGKSGIEIPEIGIGIMSWGEKRLGYGKTHNFNDIFQVYKAGLDAGINFFDTAQMYGNGESEKILGECLRQDGRPIFIATKFIPDNLLVPSVKRSRPASLLIELDNSLKRLGVDQITLFQMHMPPYEHKFDAFIDMLAEAVKSGKTKSVGVCNCTSSMIIRAYERLSTHGIPLSSAMVGYNILRRYPETNGVMDICQKLDIALIAYAPLAEGILTGKYRHGNTRMAGIIKFLFYFEQLDFHKEKGKRWPLLKRLFSRPRNWDLKKMETLFVVLEAIASAHKKSLAQVAINWLLCRSGNIIPIPGVKNLKQLNDNIGSLAWSLTEDEMNLIDQAERATRQR